MSEFRGDWDIRGSDLDQRYGRFCREPLTDDEIMWLSRADMVMPAGSVAYQLFITSRSGCDAYLKELAEWGNMVASVIAKAKYRAKGGTRHRAYVESYAEDWGKYAARDGMAIAMWGPAGVPGIVERANQFGVGKQGYQRIRDFVGGQCVAAIEEYKFALLWAMGRIRDRTFDQRYEFLTGMEKGECDLMVSRELERLSNSTGTASVAHE